VTGGGKTVSRTAISEKEIQKLVFFCAAQKSVVANRRGLFEPLGI
jgi:hypothetical protein